MKQLKVDAIKNGTVIDHIPAGKALNVYEILSPKTKKVTTIGMNLTSKIHGRKDLIKIEGLEISTRVVNRISLIAPSATLIIIRNFEIFKKSEVKIPKTVINAVKCPNIKCITNYEIIETKFFKEIANKEETLRCSYCERVFKISEFKLQE
ncbi:MAG: aspartate carbamoyltransferase regulatory subunit [Candidatus Neomarinimicrobiota bacterium]|jgi:aspartate carbamoyltransferase regulatory subunit|nr:aspartate carbamoyltransferase regulatory subunit [Candidatus Neomarinimicrobiota bacterium]